MNDLNRSQRAIAEDLEGILVVDAGPGTGKTHTIVERFVNILRKEDIDPKDVLLLTFTKNAAGEMERRVREKIAGTDLFRHSKFIQASTFDAFCYSIVMESPEAVSRFFRMDATLTRGASLIENETLNRRYFKDFFDRFMTDRQGEYGDEEVIASQNVTELYDIIKNLMSKGIYPLKSGWFGGDDGRILKGNTEKLLTKLAHMNDEVDEKGRHGLSRSLGDRMQELFPEDAGIMPGDRIPEQMLEDAADDDRTLLLSLIHDIYYEYIRGCILDDRLTFGLVSSFAFIIMYSDSKVRERMSYRYLMIDEFQDTNENQLMLSLMLLKEPNLCVVGDWKQGIYGFRHATVDNIIDFENKAVRSRRLLNDDLTRIPFQIPEVKRSSLDMNYRSSQKIIDTAYDSLYAQATKGDVVDKEYLDSNITRITAQREDIKEDTEVEYMTAESRGGEIGAVIEKVLEYVHSGRYVIHENDVTRSPVYGDIAVLCRNVKICRAVKDAAASRRIPAFLQGDMDVMSTREGKLALAWLRYVNNDKDEWGLGVILADAGYPLCDIERNKEDIPQEFSELRRGLIRKKRRVTDLLASIFSFYGLDNDLTQTIISVISSSHRNSLLTISDVIGIIEEDIGNGTTYPVDGVLDSRAITIQTMHKSKGLEYPIVIVAGVDLKVLPHIARDTSAYTFDELTGIRCRETVSRFGADFLRIIRSWRTATVRRTSVKDYGEEKRLMFVAISRAKQYVSIISGPSPSPFFTHLSKGSQKKASEKTSEYTVPDASSDNIEPPEIEVIKGRRVNVGVHDIMRPIGEFIPGDGVDEFSGKGKEYGTEIHELAYALALGHDTDDGRPEIPVVRRILGSLSDADLLLPEIECSLPFDDPKVTLKGVIDLLAVYPDRVEVHDYKTDVDTSYESEYRIQLSVYAHAASGFYGRPARCFIDYVSLNRTSEFVPEDISVIARRVSEYLDI